MLEAVLDAGRYDMVFVESSDHAYSQIKKVLPNLVILCARIERLEGFQLLTMLKLDPETRARRYEGWRRAVERARAWAEPET